METQRILHPRNSIFQPKDDLFIKVPGRYDWYMKFNSYGGTQRGYFEFYDAKIGYFFDGQILDISDENKSPHFKEVLDFYLERLDDPIEKGCDQNGKLVYTWDLEKSLKKQEGEAVE